MSEGEGEDVLELVSTQADDSILLPAAYSNSHTNAASELSTATQPLISQSVSAAANEQ